jgi:hypothetical protein
MMRPGWIELMVMPCAATSRDSPLAQAWTAALAEFAALSPRGDVDDASPPARLHGRHNRVGQLAQADEVHQQAFRPLLLGRLEGVGPAAAGGIDQDVHAPERTGGVFRQLFGGTLLVEVRLDDQRLGAARRDDFPREFLEQVDAPGGDGDLHAFAGEPQRDGSANAARGAGDEGCFAGELEIHLESLVFVILV